MSRAMKRPSPSKLRVGFILANNFTLTAFSSFIDVLRLAADEGDRSRPRECSWEIMASAATPVRSSCGLKIAPTCGLLEPKELDYIVVVGGLLQGAASPVDADTAYYLRKASAANLIGLCTGSFVLCRLGLMKKRKICVSWYHNLDFRAEFPGVEPVADRLFVVDRSRITCSGGIGAAHVAAWLVEKHIGKAVAQKALHILLIERARPQTSAQPAPPMDFDTADERISLSLLRMEQNLSVPLRISQLAAELGTSERTLERLFRQRLGITPRQGYMEIRIRHAKWMLERSRMTLPAIASELGFADASHLGRCFKNSVGVSPGQIRKGAVPSQSLPSPNPLETMLPARVFESARKCSTLPQDGKHGGRLRNEEIAPARARPVLQHVPRKSTA